MTQPTVVEFWSPVGRMVSGDMFNARTTDADGNQLITKNGPNTGQPRSEYYFAIAIPKGSPDFPAFWAILAGEARRGFPQLFDAAGNCIKHDFAFKMTDGDSVVPNGRGNKPCDREGYPGHWVFHFTTAMKPDVYHVGQESKGKEITDGNIARRGYFYQIFGTVRSNDDQRKPGIYLNPKFARLCGYGAEIVSGPDIAAAVKTAPAPSLPPGASATPLAGAPVPSAAPAAGMPAMPSTAAATVAPSMPGQAAPAPAHDFLNPPVAPAPVAPKHQMTAAAQGVPYDAFIAKGWTDALLVQHGMMLP